ncbi:MAG: 3-demethylubiquinone-9 3-methyltransferase [Candidatus Saccharibacteria bacterium]|nr:3-demethylubiquinone-9 3-methyltransferase [Candidatus Saccharibacteria bacterium]
MQKIVTNLWFDTQAEEAANYYVNLFKKDSKITDTTRYPATGQDITGKEAGSVLTVSYTLHGQEFVALNGGPQFQFTEAVSFIVSCKDQAEIDYFWNTFIADGGIESQCGWLKDKFGVSWQIIPENMSAFTVGKDSEAMKRFFEAMFPMKKLDIAALQAAVDNK